MKGLTLFLLCACTLLISACSSPTKYAANPDPALGHYGYSEAQEDSTRFQVTFAANYQTPTQTVEQYALYRCAELTVQRGYDYFIVLHTKNSTYLLGRRREPSTSKTIRMFMGESPKKNANAYDAKTLLGVMAPSIERGD
jgi:hypothetical protein